MTYIWQNWKLKNAFAAHIYAYVLHVGIQHLVEVVGMGTTCSPKTYYIFHGKFSGPHLKSEQ